MLAHPTLNLMQSDKPMEHGTGHQRPVSTCSGVEKANQKQRCLTYTNSTLLLEATQRHQPSSSVPHLGTRGLAPSRLTDPCPMSGSVTVIRFCHGNRIAPTLRKTNASLSVCRRNNATSSRRDAIVIWRTSRLRHSQPLRLTDVNASVSIVLELRQWWL
ncbi:hypothetical protein LIA77_11699 [Sarocladium implicatum]|nr:hypothetical protein LIA77_11699 [Sarocladium implicatum]